MEITKEILLKRFAEYNELYFKNKLTTPKFFFLNDKSNFGRIIYGAKNGKKPTEIWISKTLNKSDDILKETLIHEMIHQYVYERLCSLKYQLTPHGIKFRYVAWRLNKKYGIKIKAKSIF
ncbi:MAG: SprT-like domain-containing protein [Muribaculaceae bacterium]|nr:SprT-like domain-containing protein [Muribaculaceae bacterium]